MTQVRVRVYSLLGLTRVATYPKEKILCWEHFQNGSQSLYISLWGIDVLGFFFLHFPVGLGFCDCGVFISSCKDLPVKKISRS